MQELTDREKQVLNFLLKGKSYKTISRRLCISQTTVEKHVSRIYKKNGVNNRVELILKINEGK